MRELGPEWDEDWDGLAGWSECSGFMQSAAWARFKRLEGYETHRVGIFEVDRLVGGASLIYFPSAGNESIIL